VTDLYCDTDDRMQHDADFRAAVIHMARLAREYGYTPSGAHAARAQTATPVEPFDQWVAANPEAKSALYLAHGWPDDIQAGGKGMSLTDVLKAYPAAAAVALRRLRAGAAGYLDEMRSLIDEHHYSEILHHAGHVTSDMEAAERLVRAMHAVLRGAAEVAEPKGAEQHIQTSPFPAVAKRSAEQPAEVSYCKRCQGCCVVGSCACSCHGAPEQASALLERARSAIR
jgi:hypothetical protein